MTCTVIPEPAVVFGVAFGVGVAFVVGVAVAGGREVDGDADLVVSTFVAVGVLVAENPAFDTGSASGLKSARPTKKLPIATRPKHTPKKVVFQRDALRASFDRRPSAMYAPGRGAKAVWSHTAQFGRARSGDVRP